MTKNAEEYRLLEVLKHHEKQMFRNDERYATVDESVVREAIWQIESVTAENARLKAELEALKPRPVVRTQLAEILASGATYRFEGDKRANLRFTFHDNVLVKAEVKQADGEWK